MSVAAYIDPRPEPYPIRGTMPCRDCDQYKHQRCPGCMGTREERTEDWGPCMSGSFTSGTMTLTLQTMGIDDTEFSLQALIDGFRNLYKTDDLNEIHAWHMRPQSCAPPCARELLRWVLELLKTDGVDAATAQVYVA